MNSSSPDLQRDAAAALSPADSPFAIAVFRRIWVASLLSNFGLMIQGVGAAWAMTQLSPNASMIALVQTALMMPIMLWSIPAGAIADMYDRRRVAMAALSICVIGSGLLSIIAATGMLTPWSLLFFCFLVGSGLALFMPSWQASVGEQVPQQILPKAVALNSISFNIARSFGPAIGGLIVAAAGVVAAFTINALTYFPLLVVMLLWKREKLSSRLPPEGIGRAIASGVRYVVHSPKIRVVMWRCLITCFGTGALQALMPVIVRDSLHGGPQTLGVLLGAAGAGAVGGALVIARVRHAIGDERAVTACSFTLGVMMLIVAASSHILLTAIAVAIAGAAQMMCLTMFNLGIQLSVPRWVVGRALAAYQASVAGGAALGSWFWGEVAQGQGVSVAFLAAGIAFLAITIAGRWLPMPDVSESLDREPVEMGDPDVALALTGRSGPIVVEVEYRIRPEDARAFHATMQQVEMTRHRNGAYGWSIARDVAEPTLWIERFHCPTWHDFLRLRSRNTPAEINILRAAVAFHQGDDPVVVRRMLERPFGSVRWREDTPDSGLHDVLPLPNT